MKPRSPFSWLHEWTQRLPGPPAAPDWLVQGVQDRLVLWVNHVLMQEPQAMQRLARQRGRVARVQWRGFFMALQVTPAGLLDLAPTGAVVDLRVELIQASPFGLAREALAGERPAIRIEGDVQLASDIQWLAEKLRWDVEEDLARMVGDEPAHAIASAARRVHVALRRFVGGRGRASATTAGHGAA